MELSNVLFSAKYWFNLGGQGNVATLLTNVDSDAKYQYKRKKSTPNNKRDPYLETLLQLCASTGTQVYLMLLGKYLC